MKKPLLLLGALLLLLGTTIFAWPRINSLYRVLTLFDEERIVQNFSNMRGAFRYIHELPKSERTHPWPVATTAATLPAEFTFDGSAYSVADFLEQTTTTSLLVVQDGQIVFEQYRLGTDRNDQRISWSMAKSFLSALFGIAVHEGHIKSIEQPVTDYVPELKASAYNNVPIRHVLNMASGVAFDEDYLAFNSDINKMGRVLALGGSMDEFAQNQKNRARDSGVERDYVSIDTHVLAMVLRQATGRSLNAYLQEKLWTPLGTEGDAYYLTDAQGVAFALGGLNMMTRDYARFGELFRQDGMWHGQQLIPGAWVEQSTADSAPRGSKQTLGYGYQWWVPPEANGEFFAGGIYGQFIYVNRSTGTVIVKTSAHRGFRDDGHGGVQVKLKTIALFREIVRQVAKNTTLSL